MMNKWIRRRRNTLGYGVQSPSDFYFVQHVLREQSPYYAYEAIHELHAQGHLPRYSEAIDRLLFRLANHIHPSLIVEVGAGTSIVTMSMACPSARCIAVAPSVQQAEAMRHIASEHPSVEVKNTDEMALFSLLTPDDGPIGLLHIAHAECYAEVLDAALPHMAPHGLIIVEGIRSDRSRQQWWTSLHGSQATGTSYDLGDIGLLALDPSRHAQAYWVKVRKR